MERRNYPRVETCNLISYLAMRENGQIVDQGMGRVLNISQNGILLETPRLLFSEYISLMSVDVNNNLIEIKGKVVYSGIHGSDMIRNGVCMQGQHHENIKFAADLIKVFHSRKNRVAAAVMI